ncbi:hypothetical protein ACHWQZ_G000468 [Mnemiopsis leidyi]
MVLDMNLLQVPSRRKNSAGRIQLSDKPLLHWTREWEEVLPQVLLAVEAPALGGNTLTPTIPEDETVMEKLLQIKTVDQPVNTRPLVRQGGVKRKLIRAVSNADPSKNLDILVETKPTEHAFSSSEEKRASIRKTKVDNIKRAAVCSLYLQQRQKGYNQNASPLVSPTKVPPPLSPLFSPTIPIITRPRPAKKTNFATTEIREDDEDLQSVLTRSRSFAPKKQNRQREAARTNSCLARYICLPEMSVRDEIKWARRSIKLYREFSQLSTDNRTDSLLNLDNLFSDDFDKDEDIFKTVEEAEDEDISGSDDSDDETTDSGFDYLCSLSSLYRTTCPYKKFGETKLKFPFGVCCNEDGDVFVSDWEAGLIYQLENVEDELKCTRMFPKAFGVCAAGNEVFVTSEEDQHLYSIRSDSPDEKTDLGHFPSPDGICYMDGYIYVVEEQNNRVCGLTNFGDTFTVFGDNNGPFTLNKPGGLAVYPEKELLLVCDRGNKRISMWDKLGNPVDTIPLPQHPDCCSYAGYGILVVGTSQGEVLFIDLDCKQHVFTWTNKQLKNPGFITGVAVDNRQNVYICDPKNHRVIKVYR